MDTLNHGFLYCRKNQEEYQVRTMDLKTRVALFTTAIFLCSVWALAWHQANTLRVDLQKLIFDQQYARVQYIANNIDKALKVRLYALAMVAESITAETMRQPEIMQALLTSQKPLGNIFSLGLYVVSADGKGIADFPVMAGRAQADYIKREYFQEVMKTGKPVIGKPVIGRFAKEPVLLMAVPVMDKAGKITGVLVGANLVHGSDLFNEVQTPNLKQHDDIHIVSVKHRIFIASNDPARILKDIPAPGINKMLDRNLQGFEGSGITVDSKGMEVLSSASHVAATDWIVYGSLPTSIIFSPVKSQMNDIFREAAVISLFMVFVVGLFIRQQLAPLRKAATMLSEMADGQVLPGAVPVNGAPEIRQLLESFNILHLKLAEKDAARLQSEEAQQESEDKYRILFDNAGDSIFINDTEGKIVAVNQQACKTLGFSHAELMAMQVGDVDSPEQHQYVPERIALLMEQGRIEFETVHLRKDGSPVPTDVTASKITWGGQPAIMSICHDISERKQSEEERLTMQLQLQQAQKLESLGVLAGGIAHDFNNILMAIMGNADLALMRINKESPAVDNLRRIEQSAARAADLAKQMLAYSGKGKFVVEHIDMSRLVEEMHNMMEVSISKKAVFRFNLTSPLPSVEADATQLRQVIMNLVINASEAIGDKSGVIAINTGCMECDRNYLKSVWLNDNLGSGLYVSLEVSDTGCGMDSDTLAKLFDPFFTTKFTGRGLGMAAVHGIVRGHKGAIRVYSEPGKGSSFKILLPAVDRPPEIFNGHNHEDDWKGSGTVLLVDDEETVRAIGSEMLRELGFTVITAEDGRDAVEVFKTRKDIDFVILDLTMPHMDGEQCFSELRQLKPELKIIMSSGFNQQEVTQRFVGKGLAGFIQKPYRLSALRDEIRKVAPTP